MADALLDRGRTHHSVLMEQAAARFGRPKRFLFAWLCVLILLAAVVFPGITLLTLDFSSSSEALWVSELYARKERAIELRRPGGGGSMLLTFGGSAGLFAVDARMLEKHTGLPAVNFNTHGALGLDYHLARIRRTAKRGDTALLILETSMPFRDPSLRENLLKETVWTYDHAYLAETSPRRALELLYLNPFKDYVDSARRRLARARGERVRTKNVAGLYGYLQLSPNGDFTGTPQEREFVSSTPRSDIVHPGARDGLRKLAVWCRENEVNLRVAAAAVCRPEPADADRRARQYAATDALFQELGIEAWNRGAECEFPRELFIDTPHHTTPAGRQIYTEQLLKGRGRTSGTDTAPAKTVHLLRDSGAQLPARWMQEGTAEMTRSYFISDEPLDHPDCVALRDLSTFVRRSLANGAAVQFFDPSLEPILTRAGFSVAVTEQRESSLADWQRRHPHGIFLFANVGVGDVPLEILPPELRGRVSDGGFTTALIAPNRVERAPAGAPLAVQLNATTDHPFRFDILLRGDPAEQFRAGESPITIDREPIGKANSGVAVVVLDPSAGIIVEQATFTSERIIEARVFSVTAR